MKATPKATTRSTASTRTICAAAQRTDARSRLPAVRPAPGVGNTGRARARSRTRNCRRMGEMCPVAGSPAY
eukprot:13166627-Heterocapsa_arctica.AAC.1